MVKHNRICRKRRAGRKAQAALEYVHTYGWVLLVMIVLGGAMLYYSSTSDKHVVPLDCAFLSGINCLDADVDENLLSLVVVNGFGFAIGNFSINITGTCNSTANTTDGNPYSNLNVLLNNQQTTYTFECQNLTDMRLEERIVISYRNVETDEQHLKVGKLLYSPTGQ
jgi:hypothetical protein